MSGLTRSTIAAMVAMASATFAVAQTTPTPPQSAPATGAQSGTGLGAPTTHPSQIDKGQNMILPSAGESAPSAAPTMVFDCKAKPQDCTTPATPADKATAPDVSAPPATTPK
ncbi:hypothetical protein [Bosea sp. PAMC 26642]|uniref:hypothetical protein n=1 Tax=Bosea sp. (strain PAMC 26642) TaxID=1792307 RepID=UPI000A42CAC1|nr:hypothetical protein [Bosea sp. PAMC 26642]